MKSVNCSKPDYTSLICSKIEYIPYDFVFTTKCNDSSILITIISNYIQTFFHKYQGC